MARSSQRVQVACVIPLLCEAAAPPRPIRSGQRQREQWGRGATTHTVDQIDTAHDGTQMDAAVLPGPTRVVRCGRSLTQVVRKRR